MGPDPRGKTRWSPSTLNNILQNEKYKGDTLLQKHFTVDFLSKKVKRNEVEVPQYYVKGSHEAIIPPEEFELIQDEIRRRQPIGYSYRGYSPFSSRLVCSQCGGLYGSRIWHCNDQYRRVVWQCNDKYRRGTKCKTPALEERAIQSLFLQVYNKWMADREQVIVDCQEMLWALTDSDNLDAEIEKQGEELALMPNLVRGCVEENASKGLDRKAYEARVSALVKSYERAQTSLDRLNQRREKSRGGS